MYEGTVSSYDGCSFLYVEYLVRSNFVVEFCEVDDRQRCGVAGS